MKKQYVVDCELTLSPWCGICLLSPVCACVLLRTETSCFLETVSSCCQGIDDVGSRCGEVSSYISFRHKSVDTLANEERKLCSILFVVKRPAWPSHLVLIGKSGRHPFLTPNSDLVAGPAGTSVAAVSGGELNRVFRGSFSPGSL